MYAIVDILGQQIKVEEKNKYYVPKLDSEINKSITFDNVLIYSDGTTTTVGNPSVKGIKVKAKVLEHVKDDKLIVFKKQKENHTELKMVIDNSFQELKLLEFLLQNLKLQRRRVNNGS